MAFTAAILFKPAAFGKSIERSPRRWAWLGLAISWQAMGLMLLPVGAFLASAEAVRAYHQAVGITSQVIISLVGLQLITSTVLLFGL